MDIRLLGLACLSKAHLDDIVRSCGPTGIFRVWDTYYHASEYLLAMVRSVVMAWELVLFERCRWDE